MPERKQNCPCCGISFYGNKPESECPPCDKESRAHNEEEWQRMTDMVASALNPINRTKFLGMEIELQRGLMLGMMEDGMINFHIGKRPILN